MHGTSFESGGGEASPIRLNVQSSIPVTSCSTMPTFPGRRAAKGSQSKQPYRTRLVSGRPLSQCTTPSRVIVELTKIPMGPDGRMPASSRSVFPAE